MGSDPIALLLTLASIVAIAQGFASLLRDGAHSKRLRRIFYLSQPAKYIPGGIAQPVGQVALTTGEGFTTAEIESPPSWSIPSRVRRPAHSSDLASRSSQALQRGCG